MTAVNYLWDPIENNIVREIDDEEAVIAQYTTEPGVYGDVLSQRRNGQDSFYHFDGQGSTLTLTNASGDVTDTYAYSAFGEVTAHTGSTVNSFQYIGQKQYFRDEETGECDVRRRPLFVRHGRWLSTDPLREREMAKGTYIYASNNPVARLDPTGMSDILMKMFCLPIVLEPIFGPIKPITPVCKEKGFGPGTCSYTGAFPQYVPGIKIPEPGGNCPTDFQRVTDTVVLYRRDSDGVLRKKVIYYEWCIQCNLGLGATCKTSCIPCVATATDRTIHVFPENGAIPLVMEAGSKYHQCRCVV